MKGIKILAIVLATALGLLLALGLVVSVLFDPNDYRDDIAQAVGERTGRELSIDGDLELSIFPWLAVEVSAVRLSNAPGFGEQAFAEIAGARAGIRLLPLLRKQVKVSELRLDGLRLRLATDAMGRNNWDDLAGGREPQTAAQDSAGGEAGSALDSLEIGGIAIRDAAISLDDRQAGQKLELSGFELSTGPVALGTPVDLEAGFQLALDQAQTVRASLAGQLTASPGFSAIGAGKLRVAVTLTGENLPENGLSATTAIEVLSLDLDSGALQVTGLVLEAMGARLEAALSGKAVLSDQPTIRGSLHVPGVSLREVLRQAGSEIVTTDPAVLGNFSLDGKLLYDGNSAAVQELDARLDDTTLKGHVTVADLARQSLRFDLQLDRIDLDRYLPPEAEEAAGATEAAGAEEEIDLKVLRELDASGQLRIGEVKVAGLSFTDAVVSVTAADGKLRLNPLKTAFYGGQYTGDVVIDARGDTPSMSLDERITGVQMAPVVKALSEHEFLSGKAGGGFKLSASGSTVKGMLSSLSGTLDLAMVEGALEGIDVVYELQRAEALFNKQAPAARAGEPRTPFQTMKMSAAVDKGTVRSDDLDIALPVLKISGAGGMNLVDQTLDYRLRAHVHEVPPPGAVDLGDLRGATIPLRISGTLTDPKVSADIADLAKEKAKQEVEERLEEEKDKLADKLKKKLFGN